MRYGSVCSGIEAATAAWAPLGWECAFVSEVEPFPCAVLRERFGAIRPTRPLDPADVPEGKDRKLRQSWLKALEFVRPGGELPNFGDFTKIEKSDIKDGIDLLVGGSPCQAFSVAGLRKGLNDARGNLTLEFARLAYRAGARWLVWENVNGVFSSGSGRDFAAFLSLLCGWEVSVPDGGWRNSGIVTNAPGCFGVAWRVLDAQHARVPEFPRAVPQRRKRVILVGSLGSWERAAQVLFDGELCGGDTPPRRTKGEDHAAAVQGGPGDPLGPAEAELTWWDGSEAAPTWTTRSAGQRMPDKGQLPCILDRRWFSNSETDGSAPTLLGTDYKEPKAVVTGELCYPVDMTNIDGREKRDYFACHGDEGGPAYALTRRRPSGVCTDANGPVPVVRILLPVEAERLMGFPDGHTKIPWKRRPAGECPDAPRYKALGNSMCVNVMAWIGRRIDEVEKYGTGKS